MLELESIRARRERLMPICPNCSTQTIPVYQPLHHPIASTSAAPATSSSSSSPHHHHHYYHQPQPQPQYVASASASHPHSQMNSPIPQQQQLITPTPPPQQQQPILQQPPQQAPSPIPAQLSQPLPIFQPAQATSPNQQPQPQPQQQLLSISIPTQNNQAATTSSGTQITPISLSPISMIQHLPQVQLIAIAGKQSVTVECQTSPTTATQSTSEMMFSSTSILDDRVEILNKFMEMTKTLTASMSPAQQQPQPQPQPQAPPPEPPVVKQQQEDESQTEPYPPPLVLIPKANSYSQTDLRTFVNKELNTDPPPVVPTRSQGTFVDLYAEQQAAQPKKVHFNYLINLFIYNFYPQIRKKAIKLINN